MENQISFFSSFALNDVFFMAEAAYRTLLISVISISIGTFIGGIFGWMLFEGRIIAIILLGPILDIFRSVPLIIQLVLFYNFAPIIGFDLDAFESGLVILTLYTAALVANVVRGGIASVGQSMRRASRSLGMNYWQDLRYVVFPIGVRAIFPSWVGVALGVLKDSALVSVFRVCRASPCKPNSYDKNSGASIDYSRSWSILFRSILSNLTFFCQI